MTSPSSSQNPKNKFGVLFVHGLGDHTRGAALTHWGQALMQCIDNWIEGGKPAGTPQHRLANIEITFASIESQDERNIEPPNAIVTFPGESKTAENTEVQTQLKSQEWLLAESHWDSSYPSPSYAELVLWAVDVLPWTIMTHVNKTLRRAEYGLQTKASGLGRLVGAYVLLLATLMLSPFILLLVVVLSVLGSLPIPYIGNFVAAAQRGLANTVGDSYVLVGNPVSGEVIYSRLLRDLKWMCERCDSVALIAHSQGAAVAHKVLQHNADKPEVKNVELLVTMGQGLSKLNSIAFRHGAEVFFALWGSILAILAVALASLDLIFNLRFLATCFSKSLANIVTFDIFDGTGIAIWGGTLFFGSVIVCLARLYNWRYLLDIPLRLNWALLLLIGLAVVVQVPLALQTPANSPEYEPFRPLVGLIVFFGVISSHIFMRSWEKANHKELDVEKQRATDAKEFQSKYELNVPWHDYFTVKDLVPNGPLLDSCFPNANLKLDKFESKELYNKASVVGDHSWYWENIEQFTYPVSHTLVALSNGESPNLNPRTEAILRDRVKKRTYRVKWLVLLNQLLGVAFGILGALLLLPTFKKNMAGFNLPAFLDGLAELAFTLVDWTVLPQLLYGMINRIVGENEATAYFLTYGIVLLFLFLFLRLVIHIAWVIVAERTGRRAFYKDLQNSA